MTRYFHVDRTGRLFAGQCLTLVHSETTLPKYRADRAQKLEDLFSDGLSQHGHEYFNEARGCLTSDTNGAIEMFAELLRRAQYPTRPSRFQCLFACKTIGDAKRFVSSPSQPTGVSQPPLVWEVESDGEVFETDMKRLALGACWLDAFINFDAYWRQEFTAEPFIEALLPMPVRVGSQVRFE